MLQRNVISKARALAAAVGLGGLASGTATAHEFKFPTPPILNYYSPVPPSDPQQPKDPSDPNGGGFPKLPPGLPSLPPDSKWKEIPATAPGVMCAEGAPYAYFILEGDPDKLIIDFTGGGACADAVSCDTSKEPTFFKDLGITRILVSETYGRGVFDPNRSGNPFSGWTHFVIPNCTGDLNLGDHEQTYTRADGTSFKTKHIGAPNTRAALAWLKDRYKVLAKDPSKVIVVGSSAGAYGSIIWTPAVKEQFPKSMVRHLADCGAGVGDDAGAFPPAWNAAASYPAWVPGLNPAKDDVAHLGLNAIYKLEADHYPDVEFSQFNYNHDSIQSFFAKAAGLDENLWTLGLYLKMGDLIDHVRNFHSFIAAGKEHAVLVLPDIYTLETNGVKFSDWLSDFINGKQPTNVTAWPF